MLSSLKKGLKRFVVLLAFARDSSSYHPGLVSSFRAFAQNPNLIDRRQTDIRKECMAYWKVPNEMRKRPEYLRAHLAFPEWIAEKPHTVSVDELKIKVGRCSCVGFGHWAFVRFDFCLNIGS